MMYRVCPHCGANLDPNEKCDCQEKRLLLLLLKRELSKLFTLQVIVGRLKILI